MALGFWTAETPVFKVLVQRHFHDDRLDEHLREQHVQLGDDVRDGVHVLPRRKNQQRIAPLVGDDFRLAENLDLILLAAGARALSR